MISISIDQTENGWLVCTRELSSISSYMPRSFVAFTIEEACKHVTDAVNNKALEGNGKRSH